MGQLTQSKNLYFFDAIAPIVDVDSLNMDKVFRASRYDKGTADYLNCPMDKPTYDHFYDALMNADRVPSKDFEKTPYFEGCLTDRGHGRTGSANTVVWAPQTCRVD